MAEIQSESRVYELGSDQQTYFEVHTMTYTNGESMVKRTAAGTAAQLAEVYAYSIKSAANDITEDARRAARLGRRLDLLIADGQAIAAIAGASPFEIIRDEYSGMLLSAGWTIDQGAGPLPLSFTINAQGAIRYSIDGGQARTAVLFGTALRLLSYPSAGSSADFFLAPGGRRMFSLPDAKTVITRP